MPGSGGRIGARLLAEGIERRADLAMLTTLGVDLGQACGSQPLERGLRESHDPMLTAGARR